MSIILFVIFMMIYIDFDFQSQAALSINSVELAETAIIGEYSKTNVTGAEKLEELQKWRHPGIDQIIWSLNAAEHTITVNVFAHSLLETLRGSERIQKQCSYKNENPIDFLRNIRMLKEWKEMVK